MTSCEGGAGVGSGTGRGVAPTTMICPNVGFWGTVVKSSVVTGGIEIIGSGVAAPGGIFPAACDAANAVAVAARTTFVASAGPAKAVAVAMREVLVAATAVLV